jgi:hypothetical protein
MLGVVGLAAAFRSIVNARHLGLRVDSRLRFTGLKRAPQDFAKALLRVVH